MSYKDITEENITDYFDNPNIYLDINPGRSLHLYEIPCLTADNIKQVENNWVVTEENEDDESRKPFLVHVNLRELVNANKQEFEVLFQELELQNKQDAIWQDFYCRSCAEEYQLKRAEVVFCPECGNIIGQCTGFAE